MFEVVYYSSSGNTKKVATEIADELKVIAESVKEKGALAEGSFVFLGSDCYFGGRLNRLRKFIRTNDFSQRKVALFGTSADGKGNEVEALEKAVTARGATLMGKFNCRGRLLGIFNRKHPTQEDLLNARRFAGEVTRS